MGWFFDNNYCDNKKEYADYLLQGMKESRNSESVKLYEILDHSLNADGLTVLVTYSDEFVAKETEKLGKPFVNGKFIIHYLLSKQDGSWGNKVLSDDCGISIPNCPKRIIDNFKTKNPFWESAKEKQSFSVDTINKWEQAKAKRKEKALKASSSISAIKKALKEENDGSIVEVMLNDGCSYRGEKLNGRWLKVSQYYDVGTKVRKVQVPVEVGYDTVGCQSKMIKQVKVNGEVVFG